MNTLPNNSTRSVVNQSIEKKFKKIEEEVGTIRSATATNSVAIASNTNRITESEGDIENLQNDFTDLAVSVAGIQEEIEEKQDKINVSEIVQKDDENPVSSNAVATELDKYSKIEDIVTTGTDVGEIDPNRHGILNSKKPCSAGVVYDVYSDLNESLNGKVNKSDVVDAATLGNLNPVTSNAVKVETQKNADEITKIKNGTEIVGKANADKDGNEITSTYATKTALQTEINNRVTQHNEINEHLERLDESIEGFIPSEEKGIANGVATLDAEGRLPYSQLPESAMEFKGLWSASTNTPHLEDGVGTNGDFYLCTEGGEVDFGSGSITFELNDRVIYEGNTDKWYRLNGSALTSVTSVNGKSGAVTLNYNDVNALPNTTTHLSGDVPTTRKVNGKTLESDITLSASDVGALSSDTTIPTKLSELTDDSTHRLVTDSEKTSWGAKYSKPSSGIPKTDLSSDVQTSLGKADTSIQTETKLSLGTTTGSGNAITDLSVNNHTITLTKGKSFVEQVSGKGLSTNDFTTTLKNKLDGIASGAEVNVQSDWNVTDTSSDAYIKNKPTIPSAVTESTVSGWGFTKNTGTVTSAKMNGSTYSPSNGVVDLGYTVGNVVTTSGTNTYTASLSGFKLFTGAKITVVFINACTSTTPTLNVNNTGAKTIKPVGSSSNLISHDGYYRGLEKITSECFGTYTVLDLYYDGTYWRILGNPIVEDYVTGNGLSGYTIYLNGKIEQWGQKVIQTDTQVNFLITHKYKPYFSFNSIAIDDTGSGTHYDFRVRTLTTSYAKCDSHRFAGNTVVANSSTCCWYACGY